MSEYICNDKLDREKLSEDIAKMTDSEFEEFQKEVERTKTYPNKYYIG